MAHPEGLTLPEIIRQRRNNYVELHYFSPNVRFGRFLAAAFSRHILAQTDAVIVPTEKIRTMLRGYGVAQPILTVPTGRKLAPFLTAMPRADRAALRKKLGLAESDLALTYIGRLAKEKNISELLAFLPARRGR